ncbi:MAG TPA: YceI family protein [Polyangiaceae bacterium]
MKIRSKVTIGLLSSAMCVAALAHAAGYKKAEGSQDKISFATTAMKGTIDIKGTVPRLTVAQTEGEFLVLKTDLHMMSFGNGTMDKMRYNHAKKELEFKKFPEVALRVKASELSAGGKKSGKGQLTFHGVTKPVDFSYTATETGNKVKVDGNFTISLKKHGIKEPICKAEVCVADAVAVSASFTLDKQP